MAFQYAVLILFILCSFINIIAIWKTGKTAQRISKPLLMPLLLLFYLLSVKTPNLFILFALVGGFLGDTFLLGSGIFFTLGLVSFLLGHVFYITAFLSPLDFAAIPPSFYLLAIPYILYSIMICKKLFPYIDKKEKPEVILYMVLLLSMSFSSLLRCWSVSGPQFMLPFIGSLLFIASDSMLAFQVFQKTSNKRAGVAIMVTYLLAQSLIVAGLIL